MHLFFWRLSEPVREVFSHREMWSGFSPRRSDSVAKSQRLRQPEERLCPVRNVPAAPRCFVIFSCSLDSMLCEFSPLGRRLVRLPWCVWLPGRAVGWSVLLQHGNLCASRPALPDGRGNESEGWQDPLCWWIWPCCWRPAGRGWREVSQALL